MTAVRIIFVASTMSLLTLAGKFRGRSGINVTMVTLATWWA
ncbi:MULTISPECIES: hypothetical protein [unclassified Methanoculleus]